MKWPEIKRIHLCHYMDGRTDMWEILDTERDYIGAASNGLISRSFLKDIIQEDSLTSLLLSLYDAGDRRFYIVYNMIYMDGTDRYQKHPDQINIIPLIGENRKMIEGVVNSTGYSKIYISELWIREDDTLKKVFGFDMKKELFGDEE